MTMPSAPCARRYRSAVRALAPILLGAALFAGSLSAAVPPGQGPSAGGSQSQFKVTLLGTAGGPSQMGFERVETGVLVQAGPETLLFDCGRGVPERLAQLGSLGVSKVFLTHLHSDHTQGLPILWMSGWQGRNQNNFTVYGPATGPNQPVGTIGMGTSIANAWATNTYIRENLVEKYPAGGIVYNAQEISQGVVYSANGVKVTAFLVDHDPVMPAFGYRVDYSGYSVTLSGDTRPTANLIQYAAGTDVLIHEVFNAAPGSAAPTAAYHTVPEQAAAIFQSVAPRMAVYYHIAPAVFDPTPRTRAAGYAGPLTVGTDLTAINIGQAVTVTTCPSPDTPAISAVDNAADGTPALSAGETIVVWGTGFTATGGNSLTFSQTDSSGKVTSVTAGESSGGYFWDASYTLIGTALGSSIGAGNWNVTAKNACGISSPAFAVTIH